MLLLIFKSTSSFLFVFVFIILFYSIQPFPFLFFWKIVHVGILETASQTFLVGGMVVYT